MVNEEGKVPCVLVGQDGNAFAIIGRVSAALKKHGQKDKVAEFHAKATSGDYDNLLTTAMNYCFNVTEKEMEKYEANNCDVCRVADVDDCVECHCNSCEKTNCWECDDRSDSFDEQFEENDPYDYDDDYQDGFYDDEESDDPCGEYDILEDDVCINRNGACDSRLNELKSRV